ncbi:MAG: DUF1573 domain-containing protein [Bacteroidales bacterium]|nr:DUF1573 domain-containing protein [Bacteroidales bacterium]
MKRICVLLVLAFAVSFCVAQNSKQSNSKQNGSKQVETVPTYTGAEIQFNKNVCDLGTVKLNEVVTDTFTFTNVGKKPLVLYNVTAACNCTKVEYSTAPVMPGKTGTIKVIFKADKPDDVGARTKRITVDSNAKSDRVILTLKANVVMD